MAYMDCPECGKTMLSIATQCPHCGYQLPPQQLRISLPPPQPRKVRPMLVVALAFATVVAAVAAIQSWTGSRPKAGDLAAPAVTTTPRTQDTSLAVPTDTAGVAPTVADSQPGADADSTPEPAPAAAPPAVAPPTLPRPTTAPGGDRVRRYASTWVNVRQGRSVDAPTVRVLQPGDPVLVDSLLEGWYRVLLDGRPIGYAHRANLAVSAP